MHPVWTGGYAPMKSTFLQPEHYAYPNGGETRKGAAIYPDGIIRRVWVGIPDTVWTIPAHGRVNGRYVAGYVDCDDDGYYHFHERGLHA